MANELDLEFARSYRREADRRFPGQVEEVRIFGSRARGEARPQSDLDLFVMTRHDDRALRNALVDLAWDLAFAIELPYPVTAHVMSRSHFQLLERLEMRLARDIRCEGLAV